MSKKCPLSSILKFHFFKSWLALFCPKWVDAVPVDAFASLRGLQGKKSYIYGLPNSLMKIAAHFLIYNKRKRIAGRRTHCRPLDTLGVFFSFRKM